MTEKEKSIVFNSWVQEYASMIYSVAYRMVPHAMDADDIVQNTFLKAWKYFESFNHESAPSTWLYKIAINESMNWKKKYVPSFNHIEFEKAVGTEVASAGFMDYEQGHKKFLEAIETLPAKQKAVFIMRFYDDKSYDEMEEITGTTVGALKASYFNAKKKIEDFLAED